MKRYNASVAKTVLALSLLFPTLPPVQAAHAATGISVAIDGKTLSYDQPPVMLNNRVMVPLRSIFEALGAEVTWNAQDRSITATRNGVTISTAIDDPFIYTEGGAFWHAPDQAAIIYNNRALISVRRISEVFGAEVEWDSKNQTVRIDTDMMQFFDAVINQDLTQLKKLLASGFNPDGQAYGGQTALEYAFLRGKLDAAKTLLSAGADPDGNLFYRLIMDGHVERSKFYLDNYVPNEQKPLNVEGALFSLASFNYTELVKEFLQRGTDANVKQFAAELQKNQDPNGIEFHTPLGYAISDYNLEMVEAFLQAGADPNNVVLMNGAPRSPLMHAAERNQASLIDLLLRYQSNPNWQNKQGWSPLMVAADSGSTAAVKALLAGKADVNLSNTGGANALMIAEAHGHTEIVTLLEAAGAVRNKNLPGKQALFFKSDLLEEKATDEWTPLMKAAFLGDTGQVKTLLAQGADPRVQEGAPFKLALESNSQETIRAFLTSKALSRPEAIDAVMQWAVLTHNLELAQFALDNGANAAERIVGMGSYLVIAAEQNDVEFVKLLLEHGVDASPDTGFLPLEEAVEVGQQQTVKLLVPAYDDEKRKAHDLGEALMIALSLEDLSMVKLLLELGANPNYVADRTHYTPLQVAKKNGFPEFVTVLKEAGATE